MSDIPTCANHPERETGLRCNRCGKPICSQCAVQTPVGYRCRECVRGLTLYCGFHRFLPTLLRMRGYRVLEVPVNHRPRRFLRRRAGPTT